MRHFKLETILTVITGINLTEKFNEVYELAFYIYDDKLLNASAIIYLKDDMIKHILDSYPELTEVNYIPRSPFERELWLKSLKQKYGNTLLISKKEKELKKRKTR